MGKKMNFQSDGSTVIFDSYNRWVNKLVYIDNVPIVGVEVYEVETPFQSSQTMCSEKLFMGMLFFARMLW